MSSITGHLGRILVETQELAREHLKEPHELLAVDKIEKAVYEARKVYEQRIEDEGPKE